MRIWKAFSSAAGAAVVFALLILGSCKERDNQLSVGVDGNIREIILPPEADPVSSFAAQELQRYLQRMTDIELKVIPSDALANHDKAIKLELRKDTSLIWDGYRIESGPSAVTLIAREPRGLLYAAYTLLEQSGCSFFYPGQKEEIVPELKNVIFPAQVKQYNPILEHRGLAPYGLQQSSLGLGRDFIDWMAKNRLNFILVSEDRPSDSDGPAHGSVWKEVAAQLLPELQRRGFVIEMSEHCTPVFFPRALFKDHPEWFALNNGKRVLGEPPYSGQICYSNKDAVEYYSDAIARYAAEHPEFHIIGTWPLDGGQYCECENCRDMQTVFKAAMRVAEKVKKLRPDMLVEHLAYKTQTWEPPKMENIPSNMSVLWCPDAGKMEATAREWVAKSSRAGGTYQFEYLMGDNYRACANVWLRPQYAAGVPGYARQIGYRGVISLFLPMQNWWRGAFNNRFFAQACWDSAIDISANLDQYYKDYYREQAPAVKDIFSLIFNELHPEPFTLPYQADKKQLAAVRPPAEKILAKIEETIGKTSDEEVRLRLGRIKSYIEFFLLYNEAFASRDKADLEKLIRYSQDHPDQDMTLMYPGYIKWRNEEYFTK